MAGFDRAGGARGAAADADVLGVEQDDRSLGIHSLQLEVAGVREPGRLAGMKMHAGQPLLQPSFKDVAQFADCPGVTGQMSLGGGGGRSERDNAGNVQGAAATARLLPATELRRPKTGRVLHIQHPHSLRAMQFVAAQTSVMNARLGEIDGHFSRGLHRIRMKQDAALVSHGRRLIDRMNQPGFIVGPHQRHQCRLAGPQHGLIGRHVDPAFGIDR